MFCPNCGAKVDDGVQFCGNCGNKIELETSKKEKKEVKKREKKAKESKKGFIIVLIVLIILLVAGVSVWYLNQDDVGVSAMVVKDAQDAIEQLAEQGQEYGYENALSELTEKNTNEVNGDSYYRLQQNYQGIPVYGKTVVCASDEKGKVTSITGNVEDVDENIELIPAVTAEEVKESVKTYLVENIGIENENYDIEDMLIDDNLCIYNTDNKSVLAYVLNIGAYEIIVDTQSAEVLMCSQTTYTSTVNVSNDNNEEEDYGWQDTDGTYVLKDTKRNIYVYDAGRQTYWNADVGTLNPDVLTLVRSQDSIFGNEDDNTATSSVAMDFLNILGSVYDFYYDSFEETGLGALAGIYNDALGDYNGENAGGGIFSVDEDLPSAPPDYDREKYEGNIGGIIVGYAYNNTFDAMIDLFGHEYTHMVSRKYANWSYSVTVEESDNTIYYTGNLETGAINEGISDIFGELIEEKINEEINEEIDWQNGNRTIYDPSVNGYPEKVGEIELQDDGWLPYGSENLTDYAHGYSLLISHAAYLMWNGIDGDEAKKIDSDSLAELWYRAILLMPSDCSFYECRKLVDIAASSMELTSDQLICVNQAFDAVGITEETTFSTIYELNTESTLYVYGGNSELYDDYTLVIEGYSIPNVIIYSFGMAGDIKYNFTTKVTGAEPYALNLKKGGYILTVTDNANPERTYTTYIKVGDDDGDEDLEIYTNFGNIGVKGTVSEIQEEDGVEKNLPISGAVINIYSEDQTEAVETINMADTNGVFEIYLPVGNYSAVTEAEGYKSSTTSFEVTSEEDVYLYIYLETDSKELDASSIYSTVIEQYKAAIQNDFYSDILDGYSDEWDAIGNFVNVELLDGARYSDEYKVYYALSDINQDGRDELVIGASGDESIGEYDIFTHDGYNPIRLFDFEFGHRCYFKLYDNGIIYVSSTNNAENHGYEYYKLPQQSIVVECIVVLTLENNVYYKIDKNGKQIICEDDFENTSQKYTSNEVDLKWVEIVTEETSPNNSSESKLSSNKLYGIWYSAEAERAYIFDSTGSNIYVTENGISAVTGTYDVLDFKQKTNSNGGYDLSESMALTLYSSKQETYCKTYNIKLNNNIMVLDGYTYNHVSTELQNQFLGTWKGDEGYVEFGEEKCVIVDISGDKNTYPYYVLSDNLIAINYSGNASGAYKKIEYNINGKQLTLSGDIYWKEGSDNSFSVLSEIKNVIVGFWKEDNGTCAYRFYENGTYEYCIVSISVDGKITVNAVLEIGDYEIVNAQLVTLYPNGYRYTWQDFAYDAQNATLATLPNYSIFKKVKDY